MTPPEGDLRALVERLAQRLEALERRLDRLEGGTGPRVQEPIEAGPPPPAPPRSASLETRLGLAWINRVGVVTLILGAAFFFRYAVERGWLGESARVLLGAGAGLLAIAAAEKLWRGGQRVYAQGITGAGIALLFLSAYAAYGLYHLLPLAAAFVLMLLVAGGAAALALRYDAPAIAALGLFGGYATPLLLGGGAPTFVLAYVLALDAAARLLMERRGWRTLAVLALAATAWLYARQLSFPLTGDARATDTGFALAYYALFATVNGQAVWIAAQALAPLALAAVWGEGIGGFGVLSLALVLAGLAAAERRGWAAAAPVTLGAFWASYAAWYPQSAGRPAAPVLALITAVFLAPASWMPWRALARGSRLRLADLLTAVLAAAAYFGAAYALLTGAYAGWAGPLAIALALAHGALAALLWNREPNGALVAAGICWVLLVLAAPIELSGYRVTMAWALEGAALAWLGARFRERRAVWASLAVLALVLVRLAIFEAPMYPSARAYGAVVNTRFLSFAVAAGCAWTAAWWTGEGWPALAAYLDGHFVMLWGLTLEALGWAERVAAPENLRSVESTAVSILVAAYAVALVALGVAARSLLHRVLGLSLIALVVLKLYLYDVWLLALFYRMAAFAALGALLLAMSYLYSRFSASIESWWREGPHARRTKE